MPKLNTDQLKKTKPEETPCFKCSVQCGRFFNLMGRHKLRSFVTITNIILGIFFFALNIYIFTSSDNTNDIFDGDDNLGILCLFIYIIFLGSSLMSILLITLISVSIMIHKEEKNRNHISPINPFISTEYVKNNDEFYALIYFLPINFGIVHTLMSITILGLYLRSVNLSDTRYLALGASPLVLPGLLIIYYIFYGLYCLIIICIRECILKPYYGCKNSNVDMDVDVEMKPGKVHKKINASRTS